ARLTHDRGAEVETAAHAAGVGLRASVGGIREPELVDQPPRPALRLVAWQVVQPPDHLEVLDPRELVVDGGELPRESNRAPDIVRLAHDIEARDARGAG